MAKKYKMKAEEYISPKQQTLPLIIRIRDPKGYTKSYSHWVSKELGYQDCTTQFVDRQKKPGTCVHCDAKIPSRCRFTWDVYVLLNGEWHPKMIRMNTTSHKQLEQTVGAMVLTGKSLEKDSLALTITKHLKTKDEPWEYEYYLFRLNEADVPPPSKQAKPKKGGPSPFASAKPEAPADILNNASEDSILTGTDREVLREHAKFLFDGREWNISDLKAGFHLILSEDKGIDDEAHALEMAQYVLEHYEDLKAEYMK